MNILISLLVLGIIIMIHELGHFLSAKLFKIPVSEFSIGMGPEVYTYEGRHTKYSFRSIPVGGFVNIEGMEVEDKTEGGFNSRNSFVRFTVLFAGVFMNFFLAYMIVLGMTMSGGNAILNPAPVVGNVINSGEMKSPLKKGDLIIQIENHKIEKWEDIKTAVSSLEDKDKPKNLLIERNGRTENISVDLNKAEDGNYYLGILPDYRIEKFSFIESVKTSGKGFISIFGEILKGFKMIISGEVSRKDISGPIGIVNIVGEASKEGFIPIIWITAILSINVGIFNLLPFPALDGGRIIFVILEMFGVKVNKKLEETIHRIGILILFVLIIFITTNDFFNLSRG